MSVGQMILDKNKEIARLKDELSKAYRALYGLHNKARKHELPDAAMLTYHGPTIAAAARFVKDRSLDGSAFFIGKHVSVLHDALKL